jgi:hypothetical protein
MAFSQLLAVEGIFRYLFASKIVIDYFSHAVAGAVGGVTLSLKCKQIRTFDQ